MKPLLMPMTAKTNNMLSGQDTSGVCHGQTFHFPEGVLAFEDVKQFVFLCNPETRPFVFLRAVEPARLGFVCIDPFLICPDYQPRISDADTALLELTAPEDVLLLSIVNPAPNVRETTANLQGPLAINLRTGKGRQIICDRQDYPVRYVIWEALEQFEGGVIYRKTSAECEPNSSAA